MRANVLYFLVLIAIAMLLSSCLKVDDFPDEPIINFQSLDQSPDSMIINFSFTDGDGNFGLEDGDTIAPFNVDPYKQNLIVNYFELQDGVWQRFGNDLPITSPFYIPGTFNQRVDWIRPTGQNKTQDGEVSYAILGYFNPESDFDTCRYEICIYDRDLKKSNSEVTPFFLKP